MSEGSPMAMQDGSKALPSAAQVGERVSIRSHDPEGGFRDLLGHLVSPTQVRKKNGEIVTFDPSQIVLWRVVPSQAVSTGIYLYDTMSRAQKEVVISDGKALRMYCCGPTVYRDAHVGNLRTFLLGDLIARLIHVSGFAIHSVQNITDVGHMVDDLRESEEPSNEEDKVLTQAAIEHIDPFNLARSYEAKFHKDISRLGIQGFDIYPRASESIELMFSLIHKLIDSGHAYVGEDNSVYFSAESFASYGALSGNKLEELVPGHRYEYVGDGAKRFHADWALWKTAGARTEMVWESPWGKGFPGWHIECSAMSLHYLHNHVDLHLGGIDLRFPHHENERAQSNAAILSEVTDHWVHGEHLLFEGRKMSKSAGNVVFLEDVVKAGYDPLALRLVFLENKYRSQMDLNWEQISAAHATLQRWRSKFQEWSKAELHNDQDVVAELIESIFEALRSDLDTPKALLKLRVIERDPTISDRTKAQLFEAVDKFFGLDINRVAVAKQLPEAAEELLTAREQARKERDFALSDQLRDQLLELKIRVIDGLNGQSWEVIP
jgi:cysteinyl-tRNA synthetase